MSQFLYYLLHTLLTLYFSISCKHIEFQKLFIMLYFLILSEYIHYLIPICIKAVRK